MFPLKPIDLYHGGMNSLGDGTIYGRTQELPPNPSTRDRVAFYRDRAAGIILNFDRAFGG
jgi:hypothetical protein